MTDDEAKLFKRVCLYLLLSSGTHDRSPDYLTEKFNRFDDPDPFVSWQILDGAHKAKLYQYYNKWQCRLPDEVKEWAREEYEHIIKVLATLQESPDDAS